MSYDVTLYVKTGPETEIEAFWRNHTSNTARMWRDAGCDLREFHGKPAADLEHSLEMALLDLRERPDYFRQYEPANGWGTYETTVEFLTELRDACALHAYATVHVGY